MSRIYARESINMLMIFIMQSNFVFCIFLCRFISWHIILFQLFRLSIWLLFSFFPLSIIFKSESAKEIKWMPLFRYVRYKWSNIFHLDDSLQNDSLLKLINGCEWRQTKSTPITVSKKYRFLLKFKNRSSNEESRNWS